MHNLIRAIEEQRKKPHVVDVRSGDTVRVHQKIREGNKVRTQIFEGLVIRTKNMNSLTASIWVRRIASGVGVEKSFLLHSPLVEKIEITKRSRVRRNYLSYMRQRSGKSARLTGVDFDREAVNAIPEAELKEMEEAAEAATEALEAEAEAAPSDEELEAAADEKADAKPAKDAPKE